MAPSESSPSALAQVRSSCTSLVAHEDSAVRVNHEQIQQFVQHEINWSEVPQSLGIVRYPLNFQSIKDEVNFLTLVSLLSFGSGFRKDLRRYCKRGASKTMIFGVIGMYISVPRLNAKFLQNISLESISTYFSLPLDVDEELSPGIYVSRPGPLRPLAEIIQNVLRDCGRKLEEHQCDDFGAFVLNNLHVADAKQANAQHLIERLVTVFPYFDDHQLCRGENVYFLMRAQLLVKTLYGRFKGSNPEFHFDDISLVTALADNVLPSILEAIGILQVLSFAKLEHERNAAKQFVLQYSSDLKDHVSNGKEIQSKIWECEVRAGVVVACDQIIQESNGRITIPELEEYLRQFGKQERKNRTFERHVVKTFHY